MRDIIVEMGSKQRVDTRRHLGDPHWENMVLLDIPRRYRHHEHLSDIKNLNWDLEPVKVSSPVNMIFSKIVVKWLSLTCSATHAVHPNTPVITPIKMPPTNAENAISKERPAH